jgi:hypothetical protein
MNPKSIVTAYEVCNMTPEEISEAEGLELETVKMVLGQYSASFKMGVREGTVEDVSDSEYRQILGAYKQLALYSDSDFVRERAMRQLINEKKGRNDNKRSSKQILKTNILLVNQMLVQARDQKGEVKLPVIELEPA